MLEILLAAGYLKSDIEMFVYFQSYGNVSVVEDMKQSIEISGKIVKEEE